LIHLYLGPFSTSTTLSGGEGTYPYEVPFADTSHVGNKVSVKVDTAYPFSDKLTTTITADKAFTYRVRIPSWVTGGNVVIGSNTYVVSSGQLQAISVPAGTSSFVLSLPAKITTG
jgi:hypothetical protein